jgi:hypothetical protein
MVTILRISNLTQSTNLPFVDARTIVQVGLKNTEKQSYAFHIRYLLSSVHKAHFKLTRSLLPTHTPTHTQQDIRLPSEFPQVPRLHTLRRESYCGLLGHDTV